MDYTFKIILNSEGTLFLKRDYNLKNSIYSKGTYIIEWAMLLRPFSISKGQFIYSNYDLKNTLNFEGTKKRGEEKNILLTQAGGRRSKEFSTTQYNSLVWFMNLLESSIYLYRDFVSVFS